jgi:hypothetical protein
VSTSCNRAPHPPPVILVHALAPSLAGLDWGIGGSTLLWKLGLEAAPRDLDLVTTAADFGAMSERISRVLGPGAPAPHGSYQSRFFARFGQGEKGSLDLFADVGVKTASGTAHWCFDPASVWIADGLPWMRPSDWVELYDLFERPERAQTLRSYVQLNR